MEQTTNIIKGGGFLIEDVDINRVITPEDFTDEQKMIAQTTSDYVENEVLPVIEKLENSCIIMKGVKFCTGEGSDPNEGIYWRQPRSSAGCSFACHDVEPRGGNHSAPEPYG